MYIYSDFLGGWHFSIFFFSFSLFEADFQLSTIERKKKKTGVGGAMVVVVYGKQNDPNGTDAQQITNS
jgi:hypothetical protein